METTADERKALEATRKAELRMKEALIFAFLLSFGYSWLQTQRRLIADGYLKELPEAADKKSLVEGLLSSSLNWEKPLREAARKAEEARFLMPSLPKKPLEQIKYLQKHPSLAKDIAEIQELPKNVSSAVLTVASDEPGAEAGSYGRPLSLWEKAQSDVRHDFQMKKMDKALSEGGDLFILSVHLNCSARCLPDQGKIVSKSLPPVDSSLWTGKKVDGRKIYSLSAMLARTDKYGYHNFIIDGFNCRHFLIDYSRKNYEKETSPTNAEAAEASEAEGKMRAAERKLRAIWGRYEMLRKAGLAESAKYKTMWDEGYREYERFANANGLSPEGFRAR